MYCPNNIITSLTPIENFPIYIIASLTPRPLLLQVPFPAYTSTLSTYRAVGTGPADPAGAGPIFGQPTHAKMLYEFWQLVQFLLQEYTSRDLRSELSCKIFLVRDGCKHALSPEERPRRSITVWGNYCELLTIDCEYVCSKDRKEHGQ